MKLFIADTNDRVRQRLASIAASVEGIAVVGEAGDVGHAVGGIKRAKPDSVIVALPLSGGSGLDVLAVAKSVNPASVTIMLTQSPCSECQQKCFGMGADYIFETSGEVKKIVTTLVLLAHESSPQKLSAGRETSMGLVRSFLVPMDESPSASFSAAEVCPRTASTSASKSSPCFLAASG